MGTAANNYNPGGGALPTVLKVLRGTAQNCRLPKKPARVNAKIPDPPSYVQGNALIEWRRMTKLLHSVKLIGNVDSVALAAYCITYARWLEAEEALKKSGLFVATKNGYVIPSPQYNVASQLIKQLIQILKEFGLTPASRSSIDTSTNLGNEGDDEF